MDLSKFYNQFREETIENIRILNDGLLALEQKADPADLDARSHLDAIFRAMHTIKGSARVLGFASIGRLAHTMEDILGAVRDGHQSLGRDLTDQLLHSGDIILELTDHAIEGRGSDRDLDEIIDTLERTSRGIVAGEAAAHPASSAPPRETPPPAAPAPAKPVAAPPEIAAAPAPQPEAPQDRSNFRSRTASRQTVRVRTDRLDRLINLTGELVIGQQVLSVHAQSLHDLAHLNQQQERTLLALHNQLSQPGIARPQQEMLNREVNTLLNAAEQMRQILRKQVEQLDQYMSQFHGLVDDLEQEVIATRLLPISTTFAALPRAVRELANTTGKEVLLELHGETTELDRKLIELLGDPLLHLVRNAVDHGIEPPHEREAAGKARQGRIRINAEAVGGEVRVTISDDGRGIDPERMRTIAVNKGMISAERAAMLSDQEALDLIFVPGFTTARLLTDISGRGVGMDVVRTNISELGGQVVLESQPGQGTQISLLLPLTLVTTRILLVRVGQQTFALPASGCQGLIWITLDSISTIEGRATIGHDGHTIPVIQLSDLLGMEAEPLFQQNSRIPAVMVGSTQRLLSLLVDDVLDEREAVVKPIGPLLELQRRYSGAVQLGDGQLVLMLNPMSLAQEARGVMLTASVQAASHTRQQRRLLIADDSFTTRELIRSILHSAGYDVTAAIDGLDALDKLRAQSYDLVVSDVEMPRMDGFTLTANIRQELGLRDLPVIIVTSLASEEHKRRGMEAGAQAYIVKSQFNQDNLLGAIQQLLGD